MIKNKISFISRCLVIAAVGVMIVAVFVTRGEAAMKAEVTAKDAAVTAVCRAEISPDRMIVKAGLTNNTTLPIYVLSAMYLSANRKAWIDRDDVVV